MAEAAPPEDRRAALSKALEDEPENPAISAELGLLELQSGSPKAAEKALRQAVDREPTVERLEWLGTALVRQGRLRESLPYLRDALALEPERASAWNTAGEALGGLGEYPGALDAFARAARHAPGFAAAHFNLGRVLRALGRHEQAVGPLQRALQLDGEMAPALLALGHSLHTTGRYQAAVRCFMRLVELRPDDPAAHTGLGAAAQMLGDLVRARDAYLRAVELAPDYPDAHSNLGTVHQGLRDLDAADVAYRRALELAPGHQDALAGFASSLDRRGRYQEALDLLEPHVVEDDVSPELVISAADAGRHLGRNGYAGVLLEKLLGRPGLAAAPRQRAHFLLGGVKDSAGEYDAAFEHFAAGNSMKPAAFNRAEYQQDVERLLEVFAPSRLDALARIDESSERPVFVVGMPRSGTSLLEQILACHPDIAGAGELTDLGRLAIGLGAARGVRFPDSVRDATAADLRGAADDYLSVLAGIDPDAARVIDKTPANHLFLGLIERLFPRARVLHCVRHPLDTALSCYSQNFAGQGIPFSYDLEDIALYYNGYLRVMAHWREHCGLEMCDVVYEELVTDQESVSRAAVEFLGLPWDSRCLRFHEAKRTVATASHAQVRRPMYASSLGRFEHYRHHLGPLEAALDWDAWRATGLAARVDACRDRRD